MASHARSTQVWGIIIVDSLARMSIFLTVDSELMTQPTMVKSPSSVAPAADLIHNSKNGKAQG
jgi:hypothetical protein